MITECVLNIFRTESRMTQVVSCGYKQSHCEITNEISKHTVNILATGNFCLLDVLKCQVLHISEADCDSVWRFCSLTIYIPHVAHSVVIRFYRSLEYSRRLYI